MANTPEDSTALTRLSNSQAGPSDLPFASDPSAIAALSSAEACTLWTEAGLHSPTVSESRLMVPGKAASEYQKACGALKTGKLTQAEEHVRKALAVYPDYAAAWVMLGQILDGQQKSADARKACLQAVTVDSSYVPPYLCLADFAARESDWNQMSALADRAQALDPVGDAYVFYFVAGAQFHLQQLRQAEANAEAALKLDVWNHMPELHYLMAEICLAKGDLLNVAVQLREYLRLAPAAANAPQARTLLAQLDVKSSK